MSNKYKLPTKNTPLPRHIKTLSMGFDVSTNCSGYAILIDGKPFRDERNEPSFGYTNMVKQITKGKNGQDINPKNKEYSTYGNRMFHGSYKYINGIAHVVYQLKVLQDFHFAEMKAGRKGIKIDNFNIVFEISEIPNFGFGKSSQNLTTVRKLALYVGAVLYAITNMIELVLPSFKDQINVKLIKPTEWMMRAGFTKSGLTQAQEISKYGMRWSKVQSLKRANEIIKKWGYAEITNDDMADAINIATMADEVRDNLFVSNFNMNKKQTLKKDEIEIARLSKKIAEYTERAMQNKNEFVDNVVWANTTDRNTLTEKADKARHTKYIKYDIEDTRTRDMIDFLTPAQTRKYMEYTAKKVELEQKIVSMRKEKVYGGK